VLQCVAVCYSVLQCVAVAGYAEAKYTHINVCVAVCQYMYVSVNLCVSVNVCVAVQGLLPSKCVLQCISSRT